MATLRFTFPSKVLRSQAEIRAVIPDKGEDCAVLWVLHGANADCNEWFHDSSIVRLARQYNLAVVSTSIFNGFGVNMAHGARYADYLETEWIPAVRAVLPCLSEKKEKNFVAGVSMGGFAAFRLAFNRPDLFSRAGAFAGSIGMPMIFERFERGIQPGHDDFYHAFGSYQNLVQNENDVIWLAQRRVKDGTAPRLFMFCGTEDFGYALNTIARDDLRMTGVDVTWIEAPGTHDFKIWDAQLPAFLDWLEVAAQ
ncbi:MAG TPA: alpha/beta hydrolase-fold protein [Candidatus Limiplasma sp.]|nr:alpha/beta hydrolase-fold protein [Candidatus Limiplasma sp.]HRX09592.1 alpha/beta hydrolase-fold protein [Candidatus Limiplasma sp.]